MSCHAPIRLALALLLLAAPALAAELRIAVIEFTNAAPSKELDSLGKGLQSMITTDLAQVPSLQLVERARMRDLRQELKLGGSGLVDPATAAKLGKLAGATHLLAGSFTLFGDKMRLDGRLFDVRSGKILLAASIDGEKDAFFELEKTLVGKIVDAVGVKLAPRERAAVARPHTTDFEAFRSFSQGVNLFDEQRYDDALAALRDAATRDSDFKLAALTLVEYQRIISELRGRADDLQVSQAQVEILERQKGAQGESLVIKKLFALAGDQAPGALLSRLAARRALAKAYGNLDSDYHVIELQSFEDRFALQRTADALTQSYFAEAVALFPRFPVLLDGDGGGLPKSLATFDAEFATQQRELACAEVECKARRIDDLKWWGNVADRPVARFGRRLHLDARGEAELHERLLKLATSAGADDKWKAAATERLAFDWQLAGDFARSTAHYTRLAALLRDPDKIRQVADAIEANRKATDLLARAGDRDLVREALLLAREHRGERRDLADLVERWAALSAGPARAPKLLSELVPLRAFPGQSSNGAWVSERYVHVGDQPLWVLQQYNYLGISFAPRSDRWRAAEVRYFLRPGDKGQKPPSPEELAVDNLILVEGVPRRDLGVRFEAVFTPAADWWPPWVDAYDRTRSLAETGVRIGDHPEVGILFGAQDIECPPTRDPKSGEDLVTRPLRAYLVSIQPDGVRLFDLTETGKAPSNVDTPSLRRAKTLQRRPLGESLADLRAAGTLTVALAVNGKAVRVVVNGKTHSFQVPAERSGFYGLQFRGVGYAGLRKLSAGAK